MVKHNNTYLNEQWRPSASMTHLKQRAEILSKIRQFFFQREVLEVETPSLSQAGVCDPYLENFQTLQRSSTNKSLFLQSSPEFHMKRLLAAGSGAIYQISKAFRDEEAGHQHNPEFTILEWYRPDFDHFQLMSEVEELVCSVLACPPAQRLSYQAAFLQYLEIDPLSITTDELRQLCQQQDLGKWLQSEDRDTLLQVIFAQLIEPQIAKEQPCFIYHFPASQASLAQIHQADPRVAERFELYYQGLELVNGFHELTDADEQVKRFKSDNHFRQQKGLEEKAIDGHFIAALRSGLPECSGVALGIDRLVMLALNCQHIEQVLSFPISRA